MDHFQWQNGQLCAESVPLQTLAATYGTPTYVYAKATLLRHVQAVRQGMGSLPHLLCYAIKANSNQALLELLHGAGCGFDAVSGGELQRARKAGAAAQDIIVSGVGKTDAEIAAALRVGVRYICIESAQEMQAVAQVAAQMNCQAKVVVRVNPDVDAQTHPYISTGLKANKFGVPMAAAAALVQAGMATAQLQMVGISCHIGSQITALGPFEDAATKLAAFCRELQQAGVPLAHVGMGGGLGIVYQGERPPDPAAYGSALARILAPLGLPLVLEPGRVLVGNAAVLLSRVVRCKQGAERAFVLIDAGMNDLLRPALYGAQHRLEPIVQHSGAAVPVDVVGPVCESGDTFASGVLLPPLQPGDGLAIRSAGAYGSAMASNYNSRPRPAEVLVDGAQVRLIRRRQSIADLWQEEYHLDGRRLDAALPDPHP